MFPRGVGASLPAVVGLAPGIRLAPDGAGDRGRAGRGGTAGSGASPALDPDALHREAVDDEVVADGGAGDVVAAAADGDEQAVIAGEGDGGEDVGGAGAAEDEGRAAVDHAVVDRACRVVARIGGTDEAAAIRGGGVEDRGLGRDG